MKRGGLWLAPFFCRYTGGMRYLLFLFTAPYSIVVGWGWVLLMRLIGAAEDLSWEPTFVLTAEWKPWAAKRWQYTTTLGRGIVYQPGWRHDGPVERWSEIQHHEHVHVRQVEDLMLLSFIVGLCVGAATSNWLLGAILWASGGAWQLPNFLGAVMRGGRVYRDSEHERAAYAQADVRDEKSWLDENTTTDRT